MNVGYRCPDPEAWRKFEEEYIEKYPEPFARLHENLHKIDLEEQAFLKKMQESDLPEEGYIEKSFFQNCIGFCGVVYSLAVELFTIEPEYTSDLRLLSKPDRVAFIKRFNDSYIEDMPPYRRELCRPLRIINEWQGPCEFMQMIFVKCVYVPWLCVRDQYYMRDPEEQRLHDEFYAQRRLRRPNFTVHLNEL